MALPVAHFAVGMAVPFSVAAVAWLFSARPRHPVLVYVPLIMWLCGCLALLPKPIGWLVPPLKHVFRIPVLGDLFMFHATLTRSGTHGSAWGMILLVMMWFCVVLGYLQYFRRVRRDSRSGRSP